MSTLNSNKTVRLVLLGGGHTNTQVMKHINKANVSDNVELILVSDYDTSLYSGMCPGGVANQYKESQFSVDLVQCCKALEWTFICKKIVEINDKQNTLIAMDGTSIKYDILCIDIGSTNNECEGIKEYAISTRPLKLLMDKVNKTEMALMHRLKNDSNKPQNMSVNIVSVGGGCAGCELIMGITHRLHANISNWIKDKSVNINSTLITNSAQILINDPKALQLAVLEAMHSKNINIITHSRVTKIDKDFVYICENEGKEYRMEYDICIWSTGAAAHKLNTHSIAMDKHGWLKVNQYLQSISTPNVFGCGDCINIIEYGNDAYFPPKAGVYAVREGPIIIHNLKQYLNGLLSDGSMEQLQLREYIPQTDFLRLLNTGDGKGIGCKHGIAFRGAWVWKLKDWIDVSWMDKFEAKRLLTEEIVREFRPQIKVKGNETKEEKVCDEMLSVENAVRVLLINDETDNCEGFALQWKVLLKMNDEKQFCDAVVQLFKHTATISKM